MANRLLALRQRRAELKEKARVITGSADKESRDLTDAESADIDTLINQAESVQNSIEQEEKLGDLDRNSAGVTHINQDTAQEALDRSGSVIVGADRATLDPKAGFKSFGDFAMSVRGASVGNGSDDRLGFSAAAPGAYGNENSMADGGFLVPVEFANAIRAHSLNEDAFLTMTDSTDIEGNAMVFPADETTPWGTNGVRAYWENEAAAATETKPSGKTDELRLRKLFALVPVTDELVSDSTALSSYLVRKTGESILFKTNDALVNGTGAGQPLGVLNSGALVTVAKESGQTANTVVTNNIVKMFARMPASSLNTAVWLINQDIFPQLITLADAAGNALWMPGQNLAGSPAGTLLGRPVIMTQTCQTLGSKGDIQFVDWMSYNSITKAGGIDYATSIHLYFDAGATAFRATFRVDGQPWLSAPIAPKNGSNNLSPFVALATRA